MSSTKSSRQNGDDYPLTGSAEGIGAMVSAGAAPAGAVAACAGVYVAAQALRASQAAVAVSRQAMEISLDAGRPVLLLDVTADSAKDWLDRPGEWLSFTVSLRNYGRDPARVLWVDARAGLMARGADPGALFRHA